MNLRPNTKPPYLLVSIDPGAKPGFAVWDCGKLYSASKDFDSLHFPNILSLPDDEYRILCEMPTYYGPTSKAPARSILTLAFTAGEQVERVRWAIRTRYKPGWSGPTHLVEPRTWKGSLPKKVTHRRAFEGMAKRFTVDAFQGEQTEDVLDAVAFGAWWLGYWR